MTQIVKLKLALVFLGGVMAWLGLNEYRLAESATEAPLPIELARIEAGDIPENPHLEIGPHWRMYPELLFRYETKGGSDEVTDQTPIEYAYYPILSTAHPAAPVPEVRTFSVLVKTRRFKTVADLPQGWTRGESVQGLVVNRIYELKKDEAKLLAQSFPAVDLGDVLVLHEGRKPKSPALVFGLMGGGAGTSLAAAGWLLVGWRRRPPVQREAPQRPLAEVDA